MSDLFWTKTKPDRPGWWWRRLHVDLRILCITESQIANRDKWMEPEGEWSSEPIAEPSEPPEHELVRLLRYYVQRDRSLNMNCAPSDAEWSALADRLQVALESK